MLGKVNDKRFHLSTHKFTNSSDILKTLLKNPIVNAKTSLNIRVWNVRALSQPGKLVQVFKEFLILDV